MSVCDLNLSVDSQVFSPEDHVPLLRMNYSDVVIEECITQWGGLDFFKPEVRDTELTGDLMMKHSLRVYYKDRVNPFSQTVMSDVTYVDGEECPPRMEAPCEIDCISTTDSWTYCDIKFDKQYQVGISECVVNKYFTYGDAQSKLRESIENTRNVQAINAWNQFVCQAIDGAIATAIPKDAECFPTHYHEAGDATANAVDILLKVTSYMKTRCGNDWTIFTHRQFEIDMLQCDSLCDYSQTGVERPTVLNSSLTEGGWRPLSAFPRGLWGMPIYIAPDSVDLYLPDGTNYQPFLNADATMYYMILTSSRTFFTGVTTSMDLEHFYPTCDNPYESWQQKWMSFNKILRPEEVFILAFDYNC